MSISVDSPYTSGTAGSIQYSGLTSDINWVDFVDELVQQERFHINNLNDWRADWSNKITALQGLDSRLLVLENQADDLNTQLEFFSRTISSSSETVLTATNTSAAVPGAHTVTVASNANHQIAAQGWVDEDTTAVGDSGGDFVISVGASGTITVSAAEIGAATTLSDLRDLINNDAQNTGAVAVTATIVHDGSSVNPYRLVLSADTGGPDYAITVLRNPTKLNYYENSISPADTSSLTGTTTATITTMGSFTAAKNTVGAEGCRTYSFTGPAAQQTVGSGSWTLSWSGDNGGGSGTIDLGSDYSPGDTIEIEDGVNVSFGAGVFEGGSATFTVKAFNTNIDNPETRAWTGTSAVSSDGHYTGTTNKTFAFSIAGAGTKTVGTDFFDITWTDTEGNRGTIAVTASSYTDLEVTQGVTLSFSAGTAVGGDTFSLDVYNATVQDAVLQGLAQVEIETHSGFSDQNTTAVSSAEGTFSYTYGGAQTTLTVAANTTLTELRDLINNDLNNPGVTAVILNDGSGLSSAYHLQLIGENSGAMFRIENITHTLDNFAAGGSTGYGFSQTQKAQNAMLKVDGYPTDANDYIQRKSNSIGDLIAGVTLNLVGAGTATVSITNDTAAIRTKIEDFVDAVNGVLDYVKAMMARVQAADETYTGPMIGNYGFQMVQQKINSIFFAPIEGLTDGIDSYTLLSQIGISTEEETVTWTSGEKEYTIPARRWVIDSAELETALNNDLEAVSALFVKDTVRHVDGVAELVCKEAEQLSSAYNEADPGIVAVLIHNYEGIINNIDDKIDREERRLVLVEDRLNDRYSRLDALLGQLQGQTTMINALIKGMTQSRDS